MTTKSERSAKLGAKREVSFQQPMAPRMAQPRISTRIARGSGSARYAGRKGERRRGRALERSPGRVPSAGRVPEGKLVVALERRDDDLALGAHLVPVVLPERPGVQQQRRHHEQEHRRHRGQGGDAADGAQDGRVPGAGRLVLLLVGHDADVASRSWRRKRLPESSPPSGAGRASARWSPSWRGWASSTRSSPAWLSTDSPTRATNTATSCRPSSSPGGCSTHRPRPTRSSCASTMSSSSRGSAASTRRGPRRSWRSACAGELRGS